MIGYLNSITADILFVVIIVSVWLWFTCGPLSENHPPFWEALERQIVYVGLIIGACSIFLLNIGIEGTVVEKFITAEIIGFKWSSLVLVNLAIAINGVVAITLTQSDDPKVSKWACVFGLIGQPAWFALAIMGNSYGLLVVSVMYAQAWWKGFNRLWLKPWLLQRSSRKKIVDDFIYIPYRDPVSNPSTGDICFDADGRLLRFTGKIWEQVEIFRENIDRGEIRAL